MPTSLNGLNIVQPVPSDLTSQDLLSGPFPDLSLWTHLPFDADDGATSPATNESRFGQMGEEDKEGRSGLEIETAAIHDGHVNVVTGTTVGNFSLLPQTPSTPGSSLDLASILSSFGINPLVTAQQAAPSLAQLLAMNAANSLIRYSDTTDTHTPHRVEPHPAETDLTPPPTKRQRVRKSSVSTRESSPDSPAGALSSPLTTAEDKRRRNTVASARFRLKKKERELALEKKAKELEIKVNELEKECEGLRHENGWLKGLVVGVTGAAQKQPAAAEILS